MTNFNTNLPEVEEWIRNNEAVHLIYIGFNEPPIIEGIVAQTYSSSEISEIINDTQSADKSIVVCDYGERSFFLCHELREITGSRAIFHLKGGTKDNSFKKSK